MSLSCYPAEAIDKLNNSVRVREVDTNDFMALFVPGGHGDSLDSIFGRCLPSTGCDH